MIDRSADVRGALRRRQRGFIINPFRFGAGGVPGAGAALPIMSGLLLHLDASAAGTITLTSSKVSQWDDRSGNGRHASQATAGNRPVVVAGPNSYDVVDFGTWADDASGDTLQLASAATGKTFVAVLEATNGGGCLFGHSSNYPFHRATFNNPGDPLLSATYGAAALRTGSATTRRNGFAITPTITGYEAAYHVVVFRSDGTGIAVNQLCADRGSKYGGAILAEVAIYDSVLSDTDVKTLEGHLAQKWDFANRLPSDHPGYLGAAPETLPITPTPILWFDPSDADQVYVAGALLRQLYDKSLNGRSAVRGDRYADTEPALLTAEQNGLDAADFGPAGTSGSKHLAYPDATGKSFFLVIGCSATRTGGFMFGNSSAYPFHRGGAAGANLSDAILSSSYAASSLRTGSATTRKDGAAVDPTSTGLDTGWQILAFRSDGTANTVNRLFEDRGGQLGGSIMGDVIVFDSVLSDSDTEKIEGYLAHKWGTASKLPGDHPYKSSPP